MQISKMQVNPTNFPSLPAKLLPPPPLRNFKSSQVRPKAISTTATATTSPGRNHSERISPYDDEVAAFWDYQFLFISQRTETSHPITLQVVDGQVPSDFPTGTYYLAGPGLFSDDHGSTVHPLDAHGYVKSFRITEAEEEEEEEGRRVRKVVSYMAKYVKTEAQMEEHDEETDTWRFTHRGPFSLLKGGKRVGNTKVMKNVANTSVLRWGGRLLCLWEGGDPYEIDSRSLDTVGKFQLIDKNKQFVADAGHCADVWDFAAGLLKPVLYGLFKMPPKRLLSHYKLDNKRDRLLTMSCNAEDMLMPRNNFTFYGAILAVCGLSPMISTLSVNPSTTSPIYLLPRFSSDDQSLKRDWRVPIEARLPMWLNHVGNAFQSFDKQGNSEIHIHAATCSYEWFNFHKLFGYNWKSEKLDPSAMNFTKESDYELLPHLVDITINLGTHGSYEKCEVEPLNKWNKATDFPIINPAFSGDKHRYVYAATCSGSRRTLPNFPFDTVVKMDGKDKSVSTWTAPRRTFVGEPIFVPKSCVGEEDDGYLLVVEVLCSGDTEVLSCDIGSQDDWCT
ncbi:Carotenoid cleavage dioxygenase 7, chloroplastic [Linum grandiflorum]